MSVTALATVREAIRAKVAAVPGIGVVHDRIRLAEDIATVESLYRSNGKLHVWMVGLQEGSAFTTDRKASYQEFGNYAFQIQAFYGFDDAAASEKVWQDLVEDVIDAFRADKKLGGTLVEGGPLQWVENRFAQFPRQDGTLCHFARLGFAARVQLEPVP